jgi:hypothetical protein
MKSSTQQRSQVAQCQSAGVRQMKYKIIIAILLSFTLVAHATVDKAIKAVCSVILYDESGQETGSGSAVICTSNGLAVTCFHVIDGAAAAKARLSDGKEVKVLGLTYADPTNDIAIIQLEQNQKYTTVEIGDDKSIKVGDKAFTIGSPRGLSGTVADGIISAIRDNDDLGRVIQTTAPISPGSSGGALTDKNGKLIGITKSSFVDSQNINFAVPISLFVQYLQNTSITSFDELTKSLVKIDAEDNIDALLALIAEGGIHAKLAFSYAGDPEKLKASAVTFPLYVMYLVDQGYLNLCKNEISAFLKTHPHSDNLHLAIGCYFIRKAELEDDLSNSAGAERYARKAGDHIFPILKKDKTKPLACSLYLHALYYAQEFELLRQNAAQAVRTFPDSLFPWKFRLLSLAFTGRFKEALRFSDVLLQREEFDKDVVHFWRGMIFVSRISQHGKRGDELLEWAEEAIREFKLAADYGNPDAASEGLSLLRDALDKY